MGWEWVWAAWHRLSQDRPFRGGGMGPAMPGPIPWRDVRDWCAFHDYTGESVSVMDACFRALDEVFMSHHADEMAKAMAKSKSRG